MGCSPFRCRLFGLLVAPILLAALFAAPPAEPAPLAAQVAEAFFPPQEPWRCPMPKILKCSELVSGCDAVFRGETEEDVIRQAAEHSKSAHNVHEVPKSLRKKFHRLIRDEKKGI